MTTPVYGAFSNSDVDSAEEVLNLGTTGWDTLWLTFVVGTANLSAFTVEFRVHPDGDWASIASLAADYTSPEGPVLGASGDLTAAASGSTVHFLKLDVEGVVSVRIKAAGTSSTITGHFGLN
jgi:hypothetical protein